MYQQRFEGSGERLGECTGERVRGEVSATYLDYPKAAERAAQLLPGAKIVILLREPVSRLTSSFNMKWQVEICGKLTWSRSDCYNGITSVKVHSNAIQAHHSLIPHVLHPHHDHLTRALPRDTDMLVPALPSCWSPVW